MYKTHTVHNSKQNNWNLPDPDAQLRRRRQLVAVALGLFAVSIVAIAGTVIIGNPSKEYDERGCEIDRFPPRSITFLIDQSDPFSEDQLALVASDVRHRVEALGVGDLFSLFTLQRNPEKEPMTENFSRCRPLQGKDVSIWIDNPEKRDEEYKAQFIAPLNTAIKHALVPGKSDFTPLLEALHAMAQGYTFKKGGQNRTIIMYTDGLQNSAFATFFEQGYSFQQLAQLNSVYLSGLREHFAGACVEMLVASTKYQRQTNWPEFEAFWHDYWRAAGVECLIFKRI